MATACVDQKISNIRISTDFFFLFNWFFASECEMEFDLLGRDLGKDVNS